jgi:hypothetical protein
LGKSNEGQEQAKMTEQHSETNNFCAESLGIPTQEEWSNEILTPITASIRTVAASINFINKQGAVS